MNILTYDIVKLANNIIRYDLLSLSG